MEPESQQHDRQLPAWLISVVTHVLIITAAVMVVHRQPRGAAHEQARAAGIVLKRSHDSDTFYEDQQSNQPASDPAVDPPTEQQLRDALPSLAQADLSQHLPPATAPLEITTLGPGKTTGDSGPGSGKGSTRGNRSIGGAATVGVFGVQGSGHRFVYAFDRSVSMTGAPLAAAKRQLLASLSSLGKTHQFQILFFNHRVTAFDLTQGGRRIAFASEKTRTAAEEFVGAVSADGGTDRYQALSRALAMSPDVIFFLTDADDAMTAAELKRIQRITDRVGATICTIEFGRGPDRGKDNFLRELANMTDGQYGYVDTTLLTRE